MIPLCGTHSTEPSITSDYGLIRILRPSENGLASVHNDQIFLIQGQLEAYEGASGMAERYIE